MDKPDTVRLADENDVEKIYWFLINDLQQDNSVQIPVSPAKVLQNIRDCCTGNGGIAGVIDGPNGTILGSIGIIASTAWFTDATILSQIWLFVDPRVRRGTRYGDDLFQFAEWHRQDMSQRVGYSMVLENTVWSLKRLAAKIRLWGRWGTQIGAIFWSGGDEEDGDRKDGREEFDHGGDGPGGAVGLPDASGPGPEPVQPAPANLRRPSRSRTD